MPEPRVETAVNLTAVLAVQPRRGRGLKYASQSEASHWRAQRKALSIRRRFGASGEALDGPFPLKPRKMHWATYNRLRRVDASLSNGSSARPEASGGSKVG